MRGLRALIAQFARFGAVGVAATLLATGIILLLTWQGQSPYVANFTGYAVGTVFSFVANSRWTFGARLEGRRLVRFLLVIAAAYLVNLAVLALVLRMGWSDLASQLPAMVCFTVVNFLGQRHYAFRAQRAVSPD